MQSNAPVLGGARAWVVWAIAVTFVVYYFSFQTGYSIVNARAGLNFGPDQNYAVEFYVENLFNKYYNITAFPIPEQSASFAVYPAPPRLYGVKLRAKF